MKGCFFRELVDHLVIYDFRHLSILYRCQSIFKYLDTPRFYNQRLDSFDLLYPVIFLSRFGFLSSFLFLF